MTKNPIESNKDYLRVELKELRDGSLILNPAFTKLLYKRSDNTFYNNLDVFRYSYECEWVDVLADPKDEEILYAGVPFGLSFDKAKVDSAKAVLRSREDNLNRGETPQRDRQDTEKVHRWWDENNFPNSAIFFYWPHTIPGTFSYSAGAEAKAADKIKELFTEAYVELFYSAYIHSKNIVSFYSDFDYSTISGVNAEQKQAEVRTFTNLFKAESIKEQKAAATGGINALRSLHSEFRVAGASVRKVLEVCSNYIKGTFGKDWFLADYWDSTDSTSFHNYFASDKLLDAETQVQEVRHGYPRTHFTINQLTKEVIRDNPELKTIYTSDIGVSRRHS